MTRRSAGRIEVARALWYVKPGEVELRNAPLPPLEPGKVQIRMAFSGVSRGTERLVMGGLVPEAERARMRAPLQEGDFPFPVKYGYCAVGTVEAGPKDLIGKTVFCLHPHQTVFQAPAAHGRAAPRGPAAAAGDAGRQHGDRAQRAVGFRRWAGRPHRGGRRRHRGAAGGVSRRPPAGRRGDGDRPGSSATGTGRAIRSTLFLPLSPRLFRRGERVGERGGRKLRRCTRCRPSP